MAPTRRDFLALTVASYATLALGNGKAHARRPESKKLKILILGGTGFIGPHTVEAALARGHEVTIFNRGKREKSFGEPFFEGENVTRLYGNRDPELHAEEGNENSPKGLSSLADGKWDVVIDNSGYVPRIVGASASLLADKTRQYIFISSVSAYADTSKPGSDESAPLATMADPTIEVMGAQYENYGPLKVLSEQAAEKAMPGRTTIVRPGFIVGPGDSTDRFTYWPVRISKGGEVLAPGTPEDPIQLIDARDLAAWLILLAENNTIGTFDALGPAKPFTMGAVVNTSKDVSHSNATFTWVPTTFLMANAVSPGGDLPIWVPPEGESGGFHTRNPARAVAAGLTFRPLEGTIKGILDWWPGEVERRVRVTKEMLAKAEKDGKELKMGDPEKLRAGMTPEREAEVLKAWHEKKS